MRSLFFTLLFGCSVALWAQNSAPAPSHSQAPDSTSSSASKRAPDLTPPHSGTVSAGSISDEGESSSKDTQIDLSPPEGDAKAHPHSSDVLMDETAGNGDVGEFHRWDPHKAAKNVEVGDYYFKRKNYVAAESRYREALLYKDNDAMATYRLAVCLEKMNRSQEALTEFENYLKILPHGPQAEDARKAAERLKGTDANAKPAK